MFKLSSSQSPLVVITIGFLVIACSSELAAQNKNSKAKQHETANSAESVVQGTLLVDGQKIEITSLNELETVTKKLTVNRSENKTHVNNVAHFAIYADDLKRARTFYENVFEWEFSEWSGVPDFYQIETSGGNQSAIRGALQKRPESHAGDGFKGFECSISVADIKETTARIKEHGGEILIPEVEIPTIGQFIRFTDTEGNILGAIQYFEGVR